MNTMKSLILGSAAGLLAMSGAQAADLPVKAKAVEYVKVCSLYGAGFWYIPGTDTCIKLGGYMRIDANYNGGIYDAPLWNGDSGQGIGQGNRYANEIATRSRFALTTDTRTATEYGVVRTFAQADFQFSTFGASGGVNPSSIATTAGVGQVNNDTPGNGFVAVEFAFIQFAGFTFGKSASAYATPWHGYPGNNSSFLLGGHDTVTGVNNVQYSAQFGNGVSGTIGLDEGIVFNRTAIYNLSQGVAPGAFATGMSATGTLGNAYGGQVAPDIVGNIRVDQAWGLFQFSAAAHELNASYNVLGAGAAPVTGATALTDSELSGHPSSKWGGSVMAALNIKNIPTGPGDDIKIDASYAKGDTKNVIATSAASPSFAMFGSTSRAGAYQSVGFGATTDGVYLPGTTNIKLTTAYGVRGAFNHNWDPYWSSSLFGSYSAVRYDGDARTAYCGVYTASTGGLATKSADYTCNPNFNVSQLGVVTRWTPVKNLTFSAETMWFHLDQSFTGTSVLAAAAPKPTATYQFKDQDTVTLNVRVQRNF
jgi:hypothetical protein